MKTIILLLTLCAVQLNAQFTLYTPDNSDLLSHNISDIVVDYDNTIWIATDSGVVEIRNNQWATHNTENSLLPYNRIKDLFLDNYGELFIYCDESIFKYNQNGFELVRANVSGTTFAVDNSGKLLVNSNYSLLRSNNEGWDTLVFRPKVNATNVVEIEIDTQNNIFFRKEFEGGFWIIKSSNLTQNIINDKNNIYSGDIFDISIDSNQNLWLSAYGQLQSYNIVENKLTTYDENYSPMIMRNIIVRKTCTSKSNIPNFVSSVNFIKPSYFMYLLNNQLYEYSLDNYFSQEVVEWSVNAMAIDFDDNVWMHLNGVGLLKFDPSISNVKLLPNSNYSIYPNPTTDKLNIELENEALATSYKITDTKGKQVLTDSLSSSSSACIDVEQLPAGVYIIELTTSNGEVVLDKFVKE